MIYLLLEWAADSPRTFRRENATAESRNVL